MAGEWDDLVVFYGSMPWNGVRMLDQNVAEALTAYAPVLYVDPPISALTRFRNPTAFAASGTGLRQVAPRLSVLSPRVLPLKERPGGKQLAVAVTRRAIRNAVRLLGAHRVHAMIIPSLDPMFGIVDERYKVFYASDDLVAGADLMGASRRRLAREWGRRPREADVVLAVSPVLVERLRLLRVEPVLVPNGCDVELFGRAAPPPVDSEPSAVFVGHLSDRVDVALLEAVAEAGIPLHVIGPRQATMSRGRFDRLLSLPGVTASGGVRYQELPGAMSAATVCLLPYGDSDFNRASFPLKLLEYIAAGRRVVSTSLPAVAWLDTPYIVTADGPEAFVTAVRAALSEPLLHDEIVARRAFAAQHSWAARAATIAATIGLGPRTRELGGSAA